jgi:hypothetical protein
MKLFIAAAFLTFALVSATTQFPDASTGFDNHTNGMVDDATHQADQMKFDEALSNLRPTIDTGHKLVHAAAKFAAMRPDRRQ